MMMVTFSLLGILYLALKIRCLHLLIDNDGNLIWASTPGNPEDIMTQTFMMRHIKYYQ